MTNAIPDPDAVIHWCREVAAARAAVAEIGRRERENLILSDGDRAERERLRPIAMMTLAAWLLATGRA